MTMLDCNEYVTIEDKKEELFLKRIDYIVMAVCFKTNMEYGSNMKQVKSYLTKVLLMNDREAQSNADKINLACRVNKKLADITQNCCKGGIDIRELTLNELSLAQNMSWVLRKKALSSIPKKVPSDAAIPMNNESIHHAVEILREMEWFLESKKNPSLVAKNMRNISDAMVKEALYESSLDDE